MRLHHPISGKTQQGAIFNCANILEYEECKCFGIVITARCDLEHGKHSAVNYLPVVGYRDCMVRHLSIVLANRVYKDTRSNILKHLKQKGAIDLVIETFPYDEIICRVSKGAERDSWIEKYKLLELARSIVENSHSFDLTKARSLTKQAANHAETLTKDLIQQKLSEFYFLEKADCYSTDEEGYVVLLRNMQTMRTDLMNGIVSGLTESDARRYPKYEQHLDFRHDLSCMVTGVLRSPDMEHLGQQFSQLFVRIGLEDQRQSTLENHIKIVKALAL
jgi:hypothetical protein